MERIAEIVFFVCAALIYITFVAFGIVAIGIKAWLGICLLSIAGLFIACIIYLAIVFNKLTEEGDANEPV
jgi:hypothetical protein